jgi:hypothetical protein
LTVPFRRVSYRLTDWTSDLSSCMPTPELGGALLRPGYTPVWRSNQLGYNLAPLYTVLSYGTSCCASFHNTMFYNSETETRFATLFHRYCRRN